MSFNLEELRKIESKTKGVFKKKARMAIARSLSIILPKIYHAESLSSDDCHKELLQLLNKYTGQRQLAVQNGARGYGDPEWSSAAVCESWLQALLMDDSTEKEAVRSLIQALIFRAHKPKIRKNVAALAARELAWNYFRFGKNLTQLILKAENDINRSLEKDVLAREKWTPEDRVFILLQAIHFINHQREAIKDHIEAMDSYNKAMDSGIRLNFGAEIAAYMEDTPHLSKFP